MNVAQTILSQLGGNRFITMTGARDLARTDDSLTFRLPANFARDGVNLVKVTLAASDTYTVRFMKLSGLNLRECGEVEGVYAENLREVFTERTGLDCTLGNAA